MSAFTFHPTRVRRTPLRQRPLATNFPSVPAIKGAIGTQVRPKGGSKRRKASQLIATAKRDADAWAKRFRSPEYSPRGQTSPSVPHGGYSGGGGSGSHRQPPSGYRIPALTHTEYETLRWLAARGYDGGILKAAGVAKELPDGGAVLGVISEPDAWEIQENIANDPHAFLASCGSHGLAEKLTTFLSRIV